MKPKATRKANPINKKRVEISIPKLGKRENLSKTEDADPLFFHDERFWKDAKERVIKRGKFTDEEIQRLKKRLVEIALQRGMDKDELLRRLSSICFFMFYL